MLTNANEDVADNGIRRLMSGGTEFDGLAVYAPASMSVFRACEPKARGPGER